MQEQLENQYLGLSNKFYGDDAKKTFETRTRDKNWETDVSIFSTSTLQRYKNDPDHPILLALLEEQRRVLRAKKFKRTTPAETFADNHYDPFYCPSYAGSRPARAK